MVRLVALFVGAVFVLTLLVAALQPREAAVVDPAHALHLEPKEVHWQQDGPLGMGIFGTFDRAQLQRGFQVYKEVCSACHGLKRVAFRSLSDLGFTEPEVKALAAAVEVPSLNEDTGEPSTRPAIPADYIPSPYPNEIAARAANNNALPPDLSLQVKSHHHGAEYMYSLLTGYQSPPAGHEVPPGLHYNPYFANLNIAMPPPLTSDGQVTYADGTSSTIPQMAKDVVAFLSWAAEPKLEARRRVGLGVVIFLLIATTFGYLAYRRVWLDVKGLPPAARNQV